MQTNQHHTHKMGTQTTWKPAERVICCFETVLCHMDVSVINQIFKFASLMNIMRWGIRDWFNGCVIIVKKCRRFLVLNCLGLLRLLTWFNATLRAAANIGGKVFKHVSCHCASVLCYKQHQWRCGLEHFHFQLFECSKIGEQGYFCKFRLDGRLNDKVDYVSLW